MEINEAITVVSTIAGGIKEVREACEGIPIGLFKPTKRKIEELQLKIQELERNINNGFPELKRLIILYSDIKSDVSIARALSDKISEIIRLSPEFNTVSAYTATFVSSTRTDYTRIAAKINELPALDTAEAGMLTEKINRINIFIRDLQNKCNESEAAEINTNIGRIAELFQEIAGEYSGIETKLAELLNRKILQDFDI